MVDGIDSHHDFFARLNGIVASAAREHIDGIHRHGLVEYVGFIILFDDRQEIALHESQTVEIEHRIGIVGNLDVLVVAVLLALGRQRAGEEDF